MAIKINDIHTLEITFHYLLLETKHQRSIHTYNIYKEKNVFYITADFINNIILKIRYHA